jgi:hypothetical protein
MKSVVLRREVPKVQRGDEGFTFTPLALYEQGPGDEVGRSANLGLKQTARLVVPIKARGDNGSLALSLHSLGL